MSLSQKIFTCIALAVFASSAATASHSASVKPVKWVRGIYVAETPAPKLIPENIVWSVAEAAAKAVKGTTLRGNGQSMQPLYQPGTVLVIAPSKFDDLKRGQTVVYYNSDSRPVAHVLVAKCKTGWRVAGLNNRAHDDEGVTSRNLFGVVIEAYQPINTTAVASAR
ncbi:S24/S26 family peptidase [Synoicihabitans lomoniglobus]|uniref:S24/S26 family peptidase n=1 Tax=Synoicihabitans lomoniglobus TaxID=2909285 RepID=A0AAF0CRI5_9BACT|nr:S24/S26 family peptidase [Opitutaceae bacterium LMO-M01]WED66730.1 S24/S26 family peptidase [Opitutaceae bacterium LMO-M01]